MSRLLNRSCSSLTSASARTLASIGANIMVAASLVAVPGCLAANDDPMLGRSQGNVMSDNGLSYNGLSYNGLSYNGLSYNGLSYNGLSYNGLDGTVVEMSSGISGGMADSAEGRELLYYLARCALATGDTLRVQATDGQLWDFYGVLGLATEWIDEPLDAAGQEMVSGCLLAHVNAFEISVPISVRSEALLPAEGEEAMSYFYGDGAFYGNLFTESSTAFSCKIRARDYIDPSARGFVAASSPNAGDRICAGESTAAECNMVYTGYCDEVCDVIEQDGNQWHFSECLGADGVRYASTISVWLKGEGAESCRTAPDGFSCDPRHR